MKTVNVEIKPRSGGESYPIHIGAGLLGRLPEIFDFGQFSKCFLLFDSNLEARWVPEIKKSLKKSPGLELASMGVSPGEKSKDMETSAAVWQRFKEAGLDRKSLVINLGGGALCDLGGFAASTYMRGVDFIHIPTTLLAQVDASIGGKVAVNLGGIKNLIGTFTQPRAVIIDTDTLSTLPIREYRSGFAEVIKHGLIYDAGYLSLAGSETPDPDRSDFIIRIIEGSCRIKAEVVSQDETETGLRKILNFGHTIGHAVESLSHKTGEPLLHGEAIAIGMAAEARLSVLKGLLGAEEFQLAVNLIEKSGLPVRSPFRLDGASVFDLIRSDKKNVSGRIRWTLLEKTGRAVYDIEAEDGLISESIGYIQPL